MVSTKKHATPARNKSARCGLVLPIARVNRHLKKHCGIGRVGATSPVYMTAVLEYVVSEVLTAAGDATKRRGRKIVADVDVSVGARLDPDLAKLFAGKKLSTGDKLKGIKGAIAPMPRVSKA